MARRNPPGYWLVSRACPSRSWDWPVPERRSGYRVSAPARQRIHDDDSHAPGLVLGQPSFGVCRPCAPTTRYRGRRVYWIAFPWKRHSATVRPRATCWKCEVAVAE